MVGDRIPEGDPHWQHYLSMLQIMDYVLAPMLLPEEVALIQVLLVDFLTEFAHLYPQASVIPKMHYLLHVLHLLTKQEYCHCTTICQYLDV